MAVNKNAVRRAFDRAASSYDAAAVLQHEVCRRMAGRLQLIKIAPRIILDAGCGTGNAQPLLRERFPQARLVALDIAPAMLRAACARVPWWKQLLKPAVMPVCGDMERLPFAADSVGLIWSNLALQWMSDTPHAFVELHRVLAPGGLLMFSTFGPDTLKELRAAYAAVDAPAVTKHVNRFIDLHDVGDMLVQARFGDPVMDMEPFTLTYDTARAVMRDLKAIGATTVTEERGQGQGLGLSGKARLAALETAYEPLRRDGKLPATFEVVYGHAWKPQPRVTASGKRIIEIKAGT